MRPTWPSAKKEFVRRGGKSRLVSLRPIHRIYRGLNRRNLVPESLDGRRPDPNHVRDMKRPRESTRQGFYFAFFLPKGDENRGSRFSRVFSTESLGCFLFSLYFLS